MTIQWAFKFRWIAWGVLPLLLLAWRKKSFWPGMRQEAEKRFPLLVFAIASAFFASGFICKLSQLRSLSLHSQDFWLFEDMLEQMRQGGFFLTRFAPQSLGWVQHGAVHPFLNWLLAIPLSWVMGPVGASLAFGPLVFSLAGVVLAGLTRQRWSAAGALVWMVSFLASTQVGKVLMYEVHPEAAYPLFVFLWAWGAGFGDGKIRLLTCALAALGGIWIKEDSFLVFFPIVLWLFFNGGSDRKRAAVLSGTVALIGYSIALLATHGWAGGSLGPRIWKGMPVVLPAGAGVFQGRHWDSFQSAWEILQGLVFKAGGFKGTFGKVFGFLISRPGLSLVMFFPWVLTDVFFWVGVFPLAAAYAITGDPAKLWNYYSAPFLGTVWIAGSLRDTVLTKRFPKNRKLAWVMLSALIFGSGGLVFFMPSPATRAVLGEAREYSACLSRINGLGMVSTSFLNDVPRDKVWTDRIPRDADEWKNVNFVLFAPRIAGYEVPFEQARGLFIQLSSDPGWIRWNAQCEPWRPEGNRPSDDAVLFVRHIGA